MKKLMSIIFLVCGLAAMATAGPKIQISQIHWDYGKVPQNSPISHVYWIKNNGDDSLKIISVKPGCGCTTAALAKNILLPGDSTAVDLIFNTRTYRGKISKNAKVTSNDTLQNSLTIDFAVDVYAPSDTVSIIRFSPDQIQFDKTNKKQVVKVENHGNSDLHISMVSSLLPDMKLKVKDEKIKQGETGKIEFQWQGDFPKHDSSYSVTFSTALDSFPRFTVPYVIKGTEPTPIVPKPVASQIPANKNLQSKPGSDKVPAQVDTGATPTPKIEKSNGTFETPKVQGDSGVTTAPKPVQKEGSKTDK